MTVVYVVDVVVRIVVDVTVRVELAVTTDVLVTKSDGLVSVTVVVALSRPLRCSLAASCNLCLRSAMKASRNDGLDKSLTPAGAGVGSARSLRASVKPKRSILSKVGKTLALLSGVV